MIEQNTGFVSTTKNCTGSSYHLYKSGESMIIALLQDFNVKLRLSVGNDFLEQQEILYKF